MDIIFFLFLGFFVGAFGTLVGIGGGIIFVSAFIFFMSEGGIYPYFHTPAQMVGTSMVGVFLNALSGTFAYLQQKKVFFAAAIPFALATLPGAFLGSYVADSFTQYGLEIAFGIFLFLVSISMYLKADRKKEESEFNKETFSFNKKLGIFCSFFTGFISSIFGIGGGVIHVPLMVYILNFPTHIATATSHFVLAISSLVGAFSHYLLDHILWIPALTIGLGSVLGAQVGAKISQKTKSAIILKLLALMLFVVASKLVFFTSN